VRRTSGTAWGSAIEYVFLLSLNPRKMSEPPNLPAMRPLDEKLFTDINGNHTYYSDAMNIDKIKKTHDECVDLLDIIVKVHVEDGNIEALNEILRITDNCWTNLQYIIEYSITSKNMNIYNFIHYLKLFLNSSANYARFINKYDNQTIISEFCKALYKDTPCQNDFFNYIPTFQTYKKGINKNQVSLEHLLETIEKFSPPGAKPARNRK